MARAIHELSPRRGEPFVKMNCAAVPAELVESELFGHEKGAFSGAMAQRRGRFEQADGGTLFLDEIGDMPPRHAGEAAARAAGRRAHARGRQPARSRWTCASSRPPTATWTRCCADGRFREDLYYRLNTLTVRTPALRDRPARRAGAGRPLRATAACRRNHWKARAARARTRSSCCASSPGRATCASCKNVVERALILSDADPLDGGRRARRAAESTGAARRPTPPADGRRCATWWTRYERDVIRERLRRFGGHVTNAARSLGLERSHLYKKCKQLGLEIRDDS